MRRVFAIHPSIKGIVDLSKYLGFKSCITEKIIWDSNSPEFIFVSERIYTDINEWELFKKMYNPQRIFIFVSGECMTPDLNIFDYAIVFDRKLKDLDRICRIPTNYIRHRSLIKKVNDMSFENALSRVKELDFCSFIYSNPKADQIREDVFWGLMNYKHVDSLGEYLNNSGVKPTRNDKHWRELSIEMKSRYKFSIAVENAQYEGYISEKLLTSFQSHSVPIYWGDPLVVDEYNPKAFINFNEMSSISELVNHVKEIDENDELWAEMVSADWQTSEQVARVKKETEEYDLFIEHILAQSVSDAIRRPRGCWPYIYTNRFFDEKWFLKSKAKRYIRKAIHCFEEQ